MIKLYNKISDDILELSESIKRFDDYQLIQKKNPKTPRIHTEVSAFNELGENLWNDSNELLLAGGGFVLSKISNVNLPSILSRTINQDLNVQADETTATLPGPRKEDVICGFCVGIDGCGDLFDSVNPVYYKERTINGMIPFRKIPTSNPVLRQDANNYFLKKTESTYYSFYMKGFAASPEIKIEYDETGSPNVQSGYWNTTGNTPINSYLQYVLKINMLDVREYFVLAGLGQRKARVNSLSLISGYPITVLDNGVNRVEYRGCRCFSKINFNNEPFDNSTKELTVVYKIFI